MIPTNFACAQMYGFPKYGHILCDWICENLTSWCIFHLLSQVYALHGEVLALCAIIRVTALRSSNNRKINLHSKYWENKLQMLTKMAVTYKHKAVQHCNLHHCVCHE